jgi:hypothetical protein
VAQIIEAIKIEKQLKKAGKGKKSASYDAKPTGAEDAGGGASGEANDVLSFLAAAASAAADSDGDESLQGGSGDEGRDGRNRSRGDGSSAIRWVCPPGRCPRCQAQSEGRKYTGPHKRDRDCDAGPPAKPGASSGGQHQRPGRPTSRGPRWPAELEGAAGSPSSADRAQQRQQKSEPTSRAWEEDGGGAEGAGPEERHGAAKMDAHASDNDREVAAATQQDEDIDNTGSGVGPAAQTPGDLQALERAPGAASLSTALSPDEKRRQAMARLQERMSAAAERKRQDAAAAAAAAGATAAPPSQTEISATIDSIGGTVAGQQAVSTTMEPAETAPKEAAALAPAGLGVHKPTNAPSHGTAADAAADAGAAAGAPSAGTPDANAGQVQSVRANDDASSAAVKLCS